MKKVLVMVALIASAAFVSCGDKKQSNTVASNNGSSSTTSIAYVNMDSLTESYEMYNDLRLSFLKKQQDLEAELQSKGKAIERKAIELENQYKKNLITPTRAQEQQQNIMMQQQQLQQWQQQKMMELADDEAKITRMVYDSIVKTISEYNKDEKYQFVLSSQSVGGVLLYGCKEADITANIAQILNDNYKADKNTAKADSIK